MSKTQTKPRTVCFFAWSSTAVPGTQRIRSKSLCRMFRAVWVLTSSFKVCLRRQSSDALLSSHSSSVTKGMQWSSLCMCVPVQLLSRVQLFATPWTVAPRLLCPCGSPGKNPGVGCHSLLQGIFLTQRSNPRLFCLLHCRQILYPTSHLGSHHFIYEPKYALTKQNIIYDTSDFILFSTSSFFFKKRLKFFRTV